MATHGACTMGIKSHAFGRVTLTDRDAEKFKAQITYGKPKAAAVVGVHRGIEMSRTLASGGKVTITVSRKK
jgi:hypothetical protein